MNCKYCADGIGGGTRGMKFHLTYCEWNPANKNQRHNKYHGIRGFFRSIADPA